MLMSKLINEMVLITKPELNIRSESFFKQLGIKSTQKNFGPVSIFFLLCISSDIFFNLHIILEVSQ